MPFATVVTDLTTCHNTWFHPLVDCCFVPTEYCKRSALKNGLKEEQITVHGLPIRPAFSAKIASKHSLRKKLGLDRNLPAILLVGELPRANAQSPRANAQCVYVLLDQKLMNHFKRKATF